MIKEAIRKIVEGENLSQQESSDVMQVIMDGDATPSQIASLITALRMKGETAEEIAGFARTMREKSIRIPTTCSPESLVDTCGTGGDRSSTFNISTTAAFVAAGMGVSVAKHGNRAMSSRCGSADVLEALGVDIGLTPANVGKCIDEVGIGFLFAPAYHPSMRYAVVPRKDIGIRTVFNILGPLTNPAEAERQLIGVFDASLTDMMAGALKILGSVRVIVANGLDGIDELSTLGTTRITELIDGTLSTYDIEPEDLGLQRTSVESLAQGANPQENARILESILKGEIGPRRDIVLLNAGAVFKIAGMADSIRQGMDMAKESIDSGKALIALHRLIDLSAKLAAEQRTNNQPA